LETIHYHLQEATKVILDKPIRELLGDARRFVDSANRTLKRHEHYEPNPDQSHLWAWLQSAVEQAEDVIQEVEA